MSHCFVYLENYTGVYFNGSEVKGWIDCCFDEPSKVRSIKIRLICKETNEFTDVESYPHSVSHNRETKCETLTSGNVKDSYVVFNEHTLFGSDSGEQVCKGTLIYHFSYTLPIDIPSSFNGPHGCVFYKVEAVVDVLEEPPFGNEFIFVVQSPIDFNKMPKNLQKPRTYSGKKLVTFFCYKRGFITMNVELPKRAFTPGEIIRFKVTVCNMSNLTVSGLIVTFTNTVTLSEGHHSTQQTIVSVNEHGVGPHKEDTFDLQLAIPRSTHVTTFHNCKLFQVNYMLQISCKIVASQNLDICIRDILMGHIQYSGGVEDEGKEEKNIIRAVVSNNLAPEGPCCRPPVVAVVDVKHLESGKINLSFKRSLPPIRRSSEEDLLPLLDGPNSATVASSYVVAGRIIDPDDKKAASGGPPSSPDSVPTELSTQLRQNVASAVKAT